MLQQINFLEAMGVLFTAILAILFGFVLWGFFKVRDEHAARFVTFGTLGALHATVEPDVHLGMLGRTFMPNRRRTCKSPYGNRQRIRPERSRFRSHGKNRQAKNQEICFHFRRFKARRKERNERVMNTAMRSAYQSADLKWYSKISAESSAPSFPCKPVTIHSFFDTRMPRTSIGAGVPVSAQKEIHSASSDCNSVGKASVKTAARSSFKQKKVLSNNGTPVPAQPRGIDTDEIFP